MSGLLHPKNVAPELESGLKEGMVKIDTSTFRVVKPNEPKNPPANYKARAPFVALTWSVTRLDENMDPITDEHDNPKTEVLDFSFGGKSLQFVHPGQADSPDDKEIQDLGTAPGTEGNTIHIVDSAFKIHARSGIHALFESLVGKVPENVLEREWAPDWTGMTCYVKARPSGEGNTIKGDDGVERQYPVKYVEKVISMGKAGKKSAGASANGKVDDQTMKLVKPILEAIAADNAGEKMTFKVLANKVGIALKKGSVDAKLHIPILGAVKDADWLAKHAGTFGMIVDTAEQIITFEGGEE